MVFHCICKILLVRVILFDLAFWVWYRCLVQFKENFRVIVFRFSGLRIGPQSVQNLCSTLTTVAFLQSNLNLGVHGFDESSRSSWLRDSWMGF